MDYISGQSVPFAISDINHGLQEAKGLMRLSKDGISLEFEVQDSFVGYFKSDVKHVEIPYADLEAIDFRKGWFKSKIILKGISMKVFDKVPGTEQAVCTLKIKRADRKEAQNMVSKARLYLSEYRLNQLEGDQN